jgi:hypothetical protein
MQDQMRFENNKGEWIEFDKEFSSNHRADYMSCGKWAFPVYPSNLTLVGSQLTPYIYDDRVRAKDVADRLSVVHGLKTITPQTYNSICESAREWVTSDEAMMTIKWMSKNIADGINETFEKWKPKQKFQLIKAEIPTQPKHFVA